MIAKFVDPLIGFGREVDGADRGGLKRTIG